MTPLSFLKVLDLTDGNPYVGKMFADYGAEVLKIEKPEVGDSIRSRGASNDEEGIYQAYYNRGKKSMTVDIEKKDGQALIKALAPKFDMVIVNKKEEDMKAIGLGFQDLKENNPKLIYGVLTPYGESGPWKNMPDYDLLINSRSGLQEKTGFAEKPTKFGMPLGYIYASWHLSAGMLSAYLNMVKNGEGMKVSVSVWHTLMSVDDTFIEVLLGMNTLPKRIGNGFPTTNPTDTFKCKDGWFSLSIGSDAQWISFAECAGKTVWATDPRYAHDPARSMDNYFGDLDQQLRDFFSTITIEEADMICRKALVPGGPCNTVAELAVDEQVAVRNMLVKVNDKKFGETLQVGRAAKFLGKEELAETNSSINCAPLLGEHTDSYLALINITTDEITRLKTEGII